jgi:UDP-glucose 4-epimerase
VCASETAGVSRFVYFQTALCYGLHPKEQPITLSHPLDPKDSSYAISKTAGEWYVRLSDLDWISFRLANVYGPRNLSGPLPTFFQRLSTAKPVFVVDTRRDFVFVEDLVDVAMKAIDGGGESGAYHVSSGSDVAIKDLFDATIGAMGIELEDEVEVRPRNPDDAPSILLDPSKTERDFEWAARTPLVDGVAKAVDYYREYGVGETFTHLKALDDASNPTAR